MSVKTPSSIRITGQRGALRLISSWLTPLIALVAYLLFWPVPIKPVAWQAPQDLGYVGAHAPNAQLADLKTFPLSAQQEGPEHIIAHKGALYTGLSNGDVVRLSPDGQQKVLVNTGGRPLGLEIAGETLYIADVMRGLLSISLSDDKAKLQTLVDKVDQPIAGDPIRYADAVAVDGRGQVWLSDASTRFDPKSHGGTFEASVLDIMEARCSGRLVVYDPASKDKKTVLTGLCFPNGMVFSQDGQSMFVSETGRYRILKIDLARLTKIGATQPKNSAATLQALMAQGGARVLIDNLPGFPDNLTKGENGRIWTGLTKPRGKALDMTAELPWVRSMLLRLPRALWPVPPAYGHIIAFDEEGKIVDDLQDPAGAYPETTAATEMGGKLYVQSLHSHQVGWMPYTGPKN